MGFFIHLSIYIAVMIVLMIINVSTSSQYLWFKWPLMGWGIGVFFHAMGIFVFPGKSSFKEQMIQQELKKEASKNQED